jgi:hypothetical protein
MLKKYVQMSLLDIYNDVCFKMENNKPEFIKMLETYIDLKTIIPNEFYWAFYRHVGRPREYALESFVKFFLLQKILGIPCDSTLLNVLSLSRELREYCGFENVPDASKITRFKQGFVRYVKRMFDTLVDITEPICRQIDAKKADYLIYDPTGILADVAENNPKFLNSKLTNARKLAKKNPALNAHALAYASMPPTAAANPFVRQQYINGHFCYAHKAGILTNGLGIVRDIVFFDERFKRKHPQVVSQKTDNPELDKEIGDSTSLRPVLSDFFEAHPSFSYKTFLGDSAFDSYETYSMLKDEFHFERMAIPLNARNSSRCHGDFNENGVPLCPVDKTPFTFLGKSGGKNRSLRFKWVCRKSKPVEKSTKRRHTCENPCTDSPYGRCVYTYPGKDLRLCPGIPRGTGHWDNLYRHRTLIERTIYLLKDPLAGENPKSFSARAANTNLLFAGIAQLVGVLLAHSIHKPQLFKSVRKLISA